MVDNLLEMNANAAAVDIGMIVTRMDQNADFLGSDFGRSISEHKEHGVNDVRLAAAVGTNDC